MKKIFTVLLAVFFLSGCFGPFKLTKKVYEFNRDVGDKWASEIVFLGLVIVPVYGISMLGDALIFNTIQFWGGENPIASGPAEKSSKITSASGMRGMVTYDGRSGNIRWDIFKSYTPQRSMTLEKNDTGIIAKGADGKVLYASSMDKSGGISVSDSSGKRIRYFAASEVESRK